MSDYMRNHWKRQMQAADLIKVAKFVRIADTYDDKKAYEVVVGGIVVLGRVEQVEATRYRMCGNLVAQTFTPVEWEVVRKPGQRYNGLTYRARKHAAEVLAQDFLAE